MKLGDRAKIKIKRLGANYQPEDDYVWATVIRIDDKGFDVKYDEPQDGYAYRAFPFPLPEHVKIVEKEKQTHHLYRSNRIQGRFALDSPDGPTFSSFHPVWLKLGNYWLSGHVETDFATSFFVAAGGNFRDDSIELREGLIVTNVREERS